MHELNSPRTSLLDRVNSELADVLAGRPGSERILLELEDANAFVVSLDPGRTWFRYHHLFADLLRLELRRTLPEEVPELHRRAAEWFTQHGEVAEAIRHIQAAGDWQGAARLLADHSFSLMLDGQAQTMQALLRAFPPGADHPELALVRATVDIAQGRLDQAAAHLAVAEAHAGTAPPDRRRRLQIAIAALNLSLAGRLPGEARAGLAALDEEKARSGEVHNADAVICLAEGEPAAALSAMASVLDGTAPVIGYTTIMEAHLLAGLAYRQLGDQRAANRAAEHSLTIAEQDRVVLPFVMTGSAELLETHRQDN